MMIPKKDWTIALFFFLVPLSLMFGFATFDLMGEVDEKNILISYQRDVRDDLQNQIAALSYELDYYIQTHANLVVEREKTKKLQEEIQTLTYTLQQKQNKIKELKEWNRILDLRSVKVSAYTPTVEECDDTPFINAAGKHVREGTVAVSPDLKEQGWTFGKRVYIKNVGIFVIEDVMNPRWKNKLDVFMFDRDRAIQFGLKNTKAVLLDRG